MATRRSIAVAIGSGIFLLACSAGPVSEGDACVPGVVARCDCPGDSAGARVCGADRNFGSCECTGVQGAALDPSGEADFLLDFGSTPVGDRVYATLPLRNPTDRSVQFQAQPVAAPFEVESTEPILLAPGESGEVRWWYRPTASGRVSTVAAVASSNGEVRVRLAAEGFAATIDCEKQTVEFGEVYLGQEVTHELACENVGAQAFTLAASTLAGANAAHFGARVLTAGPVPPGESFRLALTATPTQTGTLTADLPLVTGSGEPVETLHLRASGVAPEVRCEPAVLDFGYVCPGGEASREIVCENSSPVPAEIKDLKLEPWSDLRFTWTPPQGSLVVPAGGTLRLTVSFAPWQDDRGSRKQAGLLMNLPSGPLSILLTGFAGCRGLACAPGELDFGPVPSDLPRTLAVTCTIAGEDDVTRPDDNTVVTGIGTTNPAEFTAAPRDLRPEGYRPGESFVVDVTYHPVDDSLDGATLGIDWSLGDGNGDRRREVALAGTGLVLPPCELAVSPGELRFGHVEAGREATLVLSLRNDGNEGACAVRNVRLDEDCDPAFTFPEAIEGTELEPYETLRIPVTFAPRATRTSAFTCDVQFDVSHPTDRHRSVPVTGASMDSCVSIEPGELEFGWVAPGCATADREVRVVNRCSASIALVDLALGEGSGEAFGLRADPPEYPVIEPGRKLSLWAAYHPVGEGPDVGALFVQVQGEAEPHLVVLRGTASSDPVQTESFQQHERPKVDVLWVVGNNGAMAEEQAQVGHNSAAFLSFAQAQEIDFQVGVTTTGVTPSTATCPGGVNGGEDGRLFPVDNSRPRILTEQTPNFAAVWLANFAVGVCQYNPQALEAGLRALTPPLIDNCDDPRYPAPNDGNCGFLRPDAHLAVIALMDDDDESPNPASYYANAFANLKDSRHPELFRFHAIVPGAGCGIPGPNPLVEVAQSTGGSVHSVCTQDWESMLRQLSPAVFGYPICFPLRNTPLEPGSSPEAAITVRINGREVPAVDQGRAIWTIRSDAALCFDPLAAPEPGTQIEVTYRAACITW